MYDAEIVTEFAPGQVSDHITRWLKGANSIIPNTLQLTLGVCHPLNSSGSDGPLLVHEAPGGKGYVILNEI